MTTLGSEQQVQDKEREPSNLRPDNSLSEGDDMIARTPVTIALALAASISLPTFAASFNAKPGAWQMSMNTLIVGNPIPP